MRELKNLYSSKAGSSVPCGARDALSIGALLVTLVAAPASALAATSQVSLDGMAYTVSSADDSVAWLTDPASGNLVYTNGEATNTGGAAIYSADSYRSENGFRLSVYFNTSSVDTAGGDELAFGLVRDNGNLAMAEGVSPFGNDPAGLSISAAISGDQRGLQFSTGNDSTLLDRAGTRVDFVADQLTKLTLEVGRGGHWTYRINDDYEESGVIIDGIDLSETYRFAAYATGGTASKAIVAVSLENNYAPGERASNVRSTWGIDTGAGTVLDQLMEFKTIDYAGIGFNTGASTSADHFAPNKLLETLSNGQAENLHVPTWGDLSRDEPQDDPMLAGILAIKEAGLQVQAYTNSENFAGNNGAEYEVLANRFMNWCDTDPSAKAFLDKPYMTGTWDAGSETYVDTGDFPKRKYMFCYAEYVLKDYGLRYGKYMDRWVFDSGSSITGIGGDVQNNGRIEDQRIFQAFADAVHAGDPNIPLAFNNGRSNGPAAPYSDAVFFDDFMFGHAFGGNNSHAVKGGTFERNLSFIDRMEETNGSVLEGGNYTWDDAIVGNLNSKVGEGAWTFSPVKAWEDADFLEWNLRALTAGGAMSWSGSIPRNGPPVLRDYAYDMYAKLDDALIAEEAPNQPNWIRGITYLPAAAAGEPYTRTLVNGEDFFHPQGRDIFISLGTDAPEWLSINESTPGSWILGGTPPELSGSLSFDLVASESNGNSSNRQVELMVEGDGAPTIDLPVGIDPTTPTIPTPPIDTPPSTTESTVVTITKRNAPGFSIDGGNGGRNGQNVRLWESDSGNVDQQWLEISRGGENYAYQKVGTNFCIDGNNGGARSQNVWLWTCSADNANQSWRKIDAGDGYYTLEKSNAPGFVLNGQASGTNDQSVTLWETVANQNLQWQISEQ